MQLYIKKLQFTSKLEYKTSFLLYSAGNVCEATSGNAAASERLLVGCVQEQTGSVVLQVAGEISRVRPFRAGLMDPANSSDPAPPPPHGCLVFHPAAPEIKSYIKYVHCQHKTRNIAVCLLPLHLGSGAISNISWTQQKSPPEPPSTDLGSEGATDSSVVGERSWMCPVRGQLHDAEPPLDSM